MAAGSHFQFGINNGTLNVYDFVNPNARELNFFFNGPGPNNVQFTVYPAPGSTVNFHGMFGTPQDILQASASAPAREVVGHPSHVASDPSRRLSVVSTVDPDHCYDFSLDIADEQAHRRRFGTLPQPAAAQPAIPMPPPPSPAHSGSGAGTAPSAASTFTLRMSERIRNKHFAPSASHL